jgi:hypothetical protein
VSDADIAWLREVERRLESGLPLNHREMMVALRDKLPRGFNPGQVDGTLLLGAGPSVAALRILGDRSKLLPDVEKAVLFVKKRLLGYPLLEKVTAPELAKELGIAEGRAERVLMLLVSLGHFCTNASGGADGYSSITVGDERAVAEYLAFDSLEQLLEDRSRPTPRSPQALLPVRLPEPTSAAVVPNTVFILMSMDRDNDMLEDVCNTIKKACSAFDLEANRIDDLEHSDTITERILRSIRESEYIIADLSGERPNVYYEVGYAHAIGKRPILVRHKATRLHFDLLVHKVPEYANMTDLLSQLRDRLEAILGRSPREE